MKLRYAIGETLKDLRTEQHRTLRDVAKSAGMALGYLSEVERGHKEASSEILDTITNALGISVADLLILTALRMSGGVPDTAQELLDKYPDLVV